MIISMMEAYTIESFKKEGYTYEQLLTRFIEEADERTEALKLLHEKDSEQFKNAYNGDYKISFVTINGLRNLIHLRYGIPLDSYRVESNGIFDLGISEDIELGIKQFISSNWTVNRTDDQVSFYVEGKYS